MAPIVSRTNASPIDAWEFGALVSGRALAGPSIAGYNEPTQVGGAAKIELYARGRTFADGLLVDLIAALRRSRPGELLALTGEESAIGADLRAWCGFTGNSLIRSTSEPGGTRWVFRHGAAPADPNQGRPPGSRLWLYTNFDCNLCCDYCCVRSSPAVPRRPLGLARVRQIASEAP